MRFSFREIAVTLVLALLIFLGVQAALQSFKVVGSSMEDNLHQGQYLLVSKAVYWFGDPQRGDVIVFHSPQNGDRDLIKRVIATPGETVEVREGKVYVDDEPLEEPYILEEPSYTFPRTEVPEACYFVLGDNRNHSSDSHVGWMLPRENIIGKAWLCYWPPSMWQPIPGYSYAQD